MERVSTRSLIAVRAVVVAVGAVGLGLLRCTSNTGPAETITVTLTVTPPSVPAGGVVTVTAAAVPSGNVSIQQITIQATGVFSVAESVAVQGAGSESVTRNYVVPSQTPPGRVDFTATARDGSVVGHAEAPATVLDVSPPTLSGTLTGSGGGSTFAPGDTIRVAVAAIDQDKVVWVGYRMGAPASRSDSVAGAAVRVNDTFALVVPMGWVGTSTVTAFARDSSGNGAQTSLGSLAVVNAVRRPTRTIPLAAPVYDIAFDSKRSALYLSQPQSQQVAVLSTTTMTLQKPIALFGSPSGLDLSVGGDSLVVALKSTQLLAIVNLVTGRVDTVRLNTGAPGLDHLRVAANDAALVSLTFGGSGYGGSIWEYDLLNGSQRRRTDAGIGGAVTEAVPFARPVDRSRILLLIDGSCCPEEGDMYVSARDTIAVHRGTVSQFFPTVSADSTGTVFLIGASLFDQALNPITVLTSPGYNGGATVVAPSGALAYLASNVGYLKVRIPDGSVLEQVLLPGVPGQLDVLPNGQTLVAVTVDPNTGVRQLSLVDLR